MIIRPAGRRGPEGVTVELLVVPDCPHQALAAGRLRQALDDAELGGVGFTTRVVTSAAEAQRVEFTGSPTILVDGRDPFAIPGAVPGLSCRLYPTAEGLAGAPDVDQLRAALQTAAAGVAAIG